MTLNNSMSITPMPPKWPRGKGSNMGQFSVEKPVAPGSVLSGNQQSSVNGLVGGGVDFEEKAVRLEPFHWSSAHREWKLTTEAFPNKHEVEGKWLFPLPGHV